MSRFRHGMNIPAKGVIASIYLLLAVVVLVCYICLNGGTKPGVYYRCEKKIPATIKLMEGMDFQNVNGWEPLILPNTSVYIISADESTCTIVYEGADAQHTSYATDVPLSDLEYDKDLIGNVQKIHNCSVGYRADGSDSTASRFIKIVMYTASAILVISLVAFVVKGIMSKRH